MEHWALLLVVDDVWEAEHGRSFLVGGPRCRTVITTREDLSELTRPDRVYEARKLSPDASLDLLERLAPGVVRAELPAAVELCRTLEYLPLGLTLAGRLLHSERSVPNLQKRRIQQLIEDAEARLSLLQSELRPGLEGPASLSAILGLSVDRLTQEDQRRFALLSALGSEPATWSSWLASAIWACTESEAEVTIARLHQRGLIEKANGNYRMHSLLHDYAAHLRQELSL